MDTPSVFKRRFEHDDALFAAAIEEFSARGYDMASINTILERAGMSKGQFYHHFGNKETLYLELIGVVIRRKQAFFQAHASPGIHHGDLFDILMAQVRLGLAFAAGEPAVSRFSDSIIAERGNPIYRRVLAHYNFLDGEPFDTLIERAAAAGDLRDDLPLPFIKRLIGFLFTHAVEAAGLEADGNAASAAANAAAHEEKLAHLIAVLRSGMARRSS